MSERLNSSLSLTLAICVLSIFARVAAAAELWETLPETPAPLFSDHSNYAEVNGIRLFHVEVGDGVPVVVLHGGLANSDYLADQVRHLAPDYRVVAVDSRGHGRSTRDEQPYTYDLMADDVVALLDKLRIKKAAILGWSDGGIIGLDLAMRYPERVLGVFAFGANSKIAGLKNDFDTNPTFAKFLERTEQDYLRLSATPGKYAKLKSAIGKMWETQPNWTDQQLRGIHVPVWIVDGDHDEAIKRDHSIYLAATIPQARLLFLPRVSHFAFLQDRRAFNGAVDCFLSALTAASRPLPERALTKSCAPSE